MRASIILADTGRPTAVGATANLLNAGWNVTTALPTLTGGWTLPDQVVAVFIEAEWHELNKPVEARIALTDEDSQPVHIASGGPETAVAEVRQTLSIPPIAGAPNGTPGMYSVMLNIGLGMIQLSHPRVRLTWTLWIGEAPVQSMSFWVNQPPATPQIGGITPV